VTQMDSTAYAAELDPGEAIEQIPEEHLKNPALNMVERVLTAVAGAILVAFTSAVLLDVVTRALAAPVNALQAFIIGTFVWGVFLGAAVAHRRREHFRLAAIAEHYTGRRRQLFETLEHVVVMAVALWMVYYGLQNARSGMGVILPPTRVPLAAVTAAIPVCGALVTVFSVERLIYVWKRGFPADVSPDDALVARGDDALVARGEAGTGE
jgi:TRAP-type C4-dicarboxylate transport system permease small subunit